ncbi:MAG: polysaccharide pyruvyl transferase family protein [Candidatus Kariarchaeaceae archaeon]|jgi:colanic acid/amylovoran biosynthesis protein
MKKIIISNCWSFYNKGDASIAIATTDLINQIFNDPKITLLAVDHQSFTDHKGNFERPPQILPMIHTIFPFNKIRFIYSAILYVSKKYLPIIGLSYLIIQLAMASLLRNVNKKLNKILSEIDQADLVIAVGGNYLWSHEGLYNHLLPLVYSKFIKKKKLVLLGHSIGPFNNGIDQKVAKHFLEKADGIIFREEISHTYIKSNIYPPKNSMIASDYAYLLSPTPSRNPKQKVIGITIRQWLKNNPNLFQRYIQSIIKLIEKLAEKGYMIYLMPFSYLPGQENDIAVCDTVLSSLSVNASERVQKVNLKTLSPIEIIERLHELQISIMIGTRMHSAILSTIANIPPIIISYQHFKAQGISKQLKIQDYVLKIDEITFTKLLDNFNNLTKNFDAILEIIQQSVASLRKDVYDKTVSVLLPLINIKKEHSTHDLNRDT